MARTVKAVKPRCAWCGVKVRTSTALRRGGKFFCDLGCGYKACHGSPRGPGKWRMS